MKTYKIYSTHINTDLHCFMSDVQAKDGRDAMKQAIAMYGKSWTWVLTVEVA